MGLSSIEEPTTTVCLSPKIYQASGDDMDGMLGYPKKKKMFSSSSFYEEPNCIYPTVEEQVKLCRKIAESLSDDCNQKSKGANMFFKRVKKAEKWIVAESMVPEVECNSDPAQLPYVRPSKGLPKLKLILDPRQIVDMKRLLKEGVDIVEHNAVSPEVCHDIVKDLNSPTGKGAQLFAKRKKKSVEWVVDEDKVRHLLQERYQIYSPEPEPLVHPRVKALNSQAVAESVIRAAEAKVMTYPNAVPHLPVIHSLERSSAETFNYSSPSSAETFNYSYPKGWTGGSTTASAAQPGSHSVPEQPAALSAECRPLPPKHTLDTGSSLRRTVSFNNFNASPRAWNSGVQNQFRPAPIKSVKPPSVLVQ